MTAAGQAARAARGGAAATAHPARCQPGSGCAPPRRTPAKGARPAASFRAARAGSRPRRSPSALTWPGRAQRPSPPGRARPAPRNRRRRVVTRGRAGPWRTLAGLGLRDVMGGNCGPVRRAGLRRRDVMGGDCGPVRRAGLGLRAVAGGRSDLRCTRTGALCWVRPAWQRRPARLVLAGGGARAGQIRSRAGLTCVAHRTGRGRSPGRLTRPACCPAAPGRAGSARRPGAAVQGSSPLGAEAGSHGGAPETSGRLATAREAGPCAGGRPGSAWPGSGAGPISDSRPSGRSGTGANSP